MGVVRVGVGVLRDGVAVGVLVGVPVGPSMVPVERTSGVSKAIPIIENLPAASRVPEILECTVNSRISPGTCGAPVHMIPVETPFILLHS